MKTFVKKVLVRTAAYYTVLTFLYAVVMLIKYHNPGGNEGISAVRILLFLPFCFLFALANTQLSRPEPDPIVRCAIHAILTMAGVFLCVLLPLGGSGSQLLLRFVVLLILYVIIFALSALFRGRLKKTMEHDKELTAKEKQILANQKGKNS